MVALAGLVVFAGYTLVAYGWNLWNGAGLSFKQVFWPGAYTGTT
jgi:hypothetical protein